MGINISGVILSGGENKRFGGITKSNIVIGGKPIISRMLEVMSGIFDEIIIVTNTPEKFREYDSCKIVGDQFLKAGPLGGLHAAMKTSSKEAVFAFAGDMPLLEKDLISRMTNTFIESKYEALIPIVNDYSEPLHSVYSNSVVVSLEEFLKETKEFAVRDFFKKIDVHYYKMDPADEAIRSFTNINSPSDLNDSSIFS